MATTAETHKSTTFSPLATALTAPQPGINSDNDVSVIGKKQFVQLRNLIHDTTTVDSLHCKGILEEIPNNTSKINAGSLMNTEQHRSTEPKPKKHVLTEAQDFLGHYFASIKKHNAQVHLKRWDEVQTEIDKRGTYELTQHELVFGAKLAWRNAERCIGRIQWSKLQVFDCRHARSAREMYEAMINHIKYGNNAGNLRSAITVFPQRTPERGDFRVWNAQIIRYCGYRMPDGTVLGDRASVEFTDLCLQMGWKSPSPKTAFDVLPLVLQADGKDPEIFDIPREVVVEVNLRHPEYAWMQEMGLKWYALPGVSGMLLDCGGVEFCAAPFNGWYMGTEIARDFCDEQRFALLPELARRMGLDTSNPSTLWKDKAFVEFNRAVLFSFQQDNVTITDHHSASQSFMKHLQNENRARGGCPADWVWIVPPLSGSLTDVFHQEMLSYHMKPSYEYQQSAWIGHKWSKDKAHMHAEKRHNKRKFTLRDIAGAVKFSSKLMSKAMANRTKCTILYATETGRSERYARQLCDIFRYGFDANVMCMVDYDASNVVNEQLLLFVASTFGNGDAPENGAAFGEFMVSMAKNNGNMGIKNNNNRTGADCAEPGPLSNVRYSVFALGSTAYPKFCEFGKVLHDACELLGGECLLPVTCGDEMAGQDNAFKNWARLVFKQACEIFCLTGQIDMESASLSVTQGETSWVDGRFRLASATDKDLANGQHQPDHDVLYAALSRLHRRVVMPGEFLCKTLLQNSDIAERQTVLVELDITKSGGGGQAGMQYEPGDHVGICPTNEQNLVELVVKHVLEGKFPLNVPVALERLDQKKTRNGEAKQWQIVDRVPACSVVDALTHYLDITTPPKQFMLELLASQCAEKSERERMEQLAKNTEAYEKWKFFYWPNLADLCAQFPSLKIDPTLLLHELPLLQPRFYSISSSQCAHPDKIHATVAVVKYRTENGNGPEHHGVCSAFLARLQPGDLVPCFIRHAPSFRLPLDRSLPVIMIGAGTGIAPFRSFWHHRRWQNEQPVVDELDAAAKCAAGLSGAWTLYFGCRRSDEDDIYKQETAKHHKEFGVLSEVHTALSREPNMPKMYVQHIMLENAIAIHKTVTENGHVYVCGDVNMAAGVSEALVEIMCKQSAMELHAARDFIKQLRVQNRLHEDIFGTYVPAPDGGKRRA